MNRERERERGEIGMEIEGYRERERGGRENEREKTTSSKRH